VPDVATVPESEMASRDDKTHPLETSPGGVSGRRRCMYDGRLLPMPIHPRPRGYGDESKVPMMALSYLRRFCCVRTELGAPTKVKDQQAPAPARAKVRRRGVPGIKTR
jgi:hypothetical protein